MPQPWCHLWSALAFCSLLMKPVAPETICYKDKNSDNSDPYNMYSCEDSSKPNCCQQGDLNTCCDYDPTQRTILQQMTIWGLLLATMICLIFIYFCCFRARNSSGTEIRSPEEQQQQKSGCRGRLGCARDCCFFLKSGKKESHKEARTYRQDSQL